MVTPGSLETQDTMECQDMMAEMWPKEMEVIWEHAAQLVKIDQKDNLVGAFSGVPDIASAKGKSGDNGERGLPGNMGPQGLPGLLDLKGRKGELALPGLQGIKGDDFSPTISLCTLAM
ncbi:pulmonary surfactant-associated protein D-like [Carassius auratus]|uniref:Pulmonary surfactant-associated protein D-like n=1 Tax=Carassius auratus TaxID=7957 RepID=A0A6P6MBJ0_CARAU|nr:pulmonary surfactant-associated protein D-like [Carassius auratus]